MSRQEQKVAQILRRHMDNHDIPLSRSGREAINVMAVDIVRELASDAAFDILTGGDKPTIQINPGIRYRCECADPVVMMGGRGAVCQLCGLPA